MQANGATVWGIHAGKTGDADTIFTKRKVIALGWPRVGDLTDQMRAIRHAAIGDQRSELSHLDRR